MDEQSVRVPPELGRLSALIDAHIECVTGPSSELCSAALHATKHIFDWALGTEESSKPHLGTLLATLTETAPWQTRSHAHGTSATQKHHVSPMHKRPKEIDIRETPLPSLFVEGMNVDQIWQQLDLRAARVCANLQILLQGEDKDEHADSEEDSGKDENDDEDGVAEMDVDDESHWEGFSSEDDDDSSAMEGAANLEEEISGGDSEDDDNDRPSNSTLDAPRHQQKPSLSRLHFRGSNLDDGFFDLATFNTETTGEAQMLPKRKLDLATDKDPDSSEESEVDLFGSVDDLETDGMGDDLELFYNDFFELPPGMQNKSVRPSRVRFHERVSVKKIKAVGRGMPVSSMGEGDSDDDEDDDDDDDDDVGIEVIN